MQGGHRAPDLFVLHALFPAIASSVPFFVGIVITALFWGPLARVHSFPLITARALFINSSLSSSVHIVITLGRNRLTICIAEEVFGKSARFLFFCSSRLALPFHVQHAIDHLGILLPVVQTRRIALAGDSIIVAQLASAVQPNVLPHEVIGVDAAPMTANVACFVVFVLRHPTGGKQDGGSNGEPVVVGVGPFRKRRIAKSALWAASARLAKGNFTAGVGQSQYGTAASVLDPAAHNGEGRFPATNTLVQEKFLTIRLLLGGRGSLGLIAPDDLVVRLKDLFLRVQVPFATVVRERGKRYSFINYNFVFRRFFDWLGVSHYGVDFPPLKSKKKRDDICLLWLKVCTFLKEPYINSDDALFGAEYATPLAQLVAADRRRAPRRGGVEQQQPKASKLSDDGRRGAARIK